MRFVLVLLTVFSCSITLKAQAILEADGVGNTYELIEGQGFQIEHPECVHGEFGRHVTETFDTSLSKNVFVFHSHIDEDNDRCINLDRVRMEIKGASGSPSNLLHTEGQTCYYRWKFRLASDYVGSGSFCHIFQVKGQGGSLVGPPLLTITTRTDIIEVIHGDDNGNYTSLKETSIAPFKGEWIEAYVSYNSSDNGSLQYSLTRVRDNTVLLSETISSGIDMWRAGADHNRPKWGIYRKKAEGLRDEQIRFADFCVSESSEEQCPSRIVPLPPGCEAAKASQDDGNVASNVLDDDFSTRWSANGDGQWIRFCFDPEKMIKAIDIAFFKGDERQSYFDIESSMDGINYTPLLSNQSSTGTSLALERFVVDSQNVKYIRIVGHGNSENDWNSFTEVQLLDHIVGNLGEHTEVPDVQVYPNPSSSGKLIVEVESMQRLQIMTVDGAQVMDTPASSSSSVELDISHLRPGSYILEITQDRGRSYEKIFIE